MLLFYVDKLDYDIVFLDPSESFHAAKVLRLKKGTEIWLTNGKGEMAKAKLITSHPEGCDAKIIERIPAFKKRNYSLHIAIALPKSPERFEWFLEKATELGVDEITPLLCSRSVKENMRMDRLKKTIIAAAKQSVQAYFPVLHELTKYEELIVSPFVGTKLIAHCETDADPSISKLIKKETSVLILIGPEGDFTEEEVLAASANGFKPCSLGKTTLRTETAGVFACSVARIVNNA